MKAKKLFSLAAASLPVVENFATPRRSARRKATTTPAASASRLTTSPSSSSASDGAAAQPQPSPRRTSKRPAPSPKKVTPPQEAKKRARKKSTTSSQDKNNNNKKRIASFVARTESFSASWAGSLNNTSSSTTTEATVEPHTLILGTHPSVASFSKNEFYGHPMNAFWWIAGDCLCFRRATGISPSSGAPYKFTPHLRYDGDHHILSYQEQLERLTSSGFALWDVVASCQRPGSLDSDIKNEHANDIVGFCRAHPEIQKIVLANGGTGCTLFVKHFREWFATGQLVAAEHEASQKAFGAAIKKATKSRTGGDDGSSREGWTSDRRITLISAMSVSPAAAKYPYQDKRDFWDEHVYKPGLAMLQSRRRRGDDDAGDHDIVASPYFSSQKKPAK